ncbi:AraC family transcriptional regulator [Larkinella rosea]|uniref:Helix-turn-helix domain-containing protein n=1 Tax=Larkinella rosea TaxID=2025312 RepID=A0A3P1C0Q1_9BACT|nr:helix-turn-helix domain-containing protein [Larkinella rosea]RRB06633.1 helix-turn-helix domain-containing protein [Larkinella rosea]
MKLHYEDKSSHGQFTLIISDATIVGEGVFNGKKEPVSTIVCNTGDEQTVVIDNIGYTMPAKSLLPLVANQHFKFEKPENLSAWQFNRDFYCIADHDAEVGCVGFLFYGIQHPLFIRLAPDELQSILVIERLCIEDMTVKDKMQGEMLRTLLKRLIIKTTRIAKKQTENYARFTEEKMDIIRKFNLLLESYFRVHHDVQFYAETMNKSPKTLTNIFHMCQYPAPSKLIQQRIILETKRYIYYTDKSAKEVADHLGFASTAHFSRFFKVNMGINFSEFKNRERRDSKPEIGTDLFHDQPLTVGPLSSEKAVG